MTTAKCRQIPLAEPWFPEAYAQIVADQVRSGFIGPGARTKEFADALAHYLSARHSLLTVSGTVALSVAARALGLRPGDEILVPAYGVISTINAFGSIGLKPRLVDIDRKTGCMCPQRLRESIRPDTKAVCFVNFSGYTGPNIVETKKICDERGLPLIEDAACALGQTYEGAQAGTFGAVGTLSFSVVKVLTTGQGGGIVTADKTTFERAAAFIDQGDLEWRQTNLNREIGSNLRFTDIQAALGLAQLGDLEQRLGRKRENYKLLQDALSGKLFCVPGQESPLHNIVLTRDGAGLIEHLKDEGISAVRQYRTISHHPAYAHLATESFPNSDFWTEHAVYLPFGLALTDHDLERIGQSVNQSGVDLLDF